MNKGRMGGRRPGSGRPRTRYTLYLDQPLTVAVITPAGTTTQDAIVSAILEHGDGVELLLDDSTVIRLTDTIPALLPDEQALADRVAARARARFRERIHDRAAAPLRCVAERVADGG